MVHRGRMAFTTKDPNFRMAFTTKDPNFFFLFHYFLVRTTCKHIFGRTVARKSSFWGFMFVQGARHSEHLHLMHNTAFDSCAN